MNEPRITAQDVLNASAGCLQKQMYVYFTRPANGMGPVMANLEDHLEFQVALEQRGVMFGAGPFWTDDEKGWEGEGMVIIRAGSLGEGAKNRRVGPHARQRGAHVHDTPLAAERGRRDDAGHLFGREAGGHMTRRGFLLEEVEER